MCPPPRPRGGPRGEACDAVGRTGRFGVVERRNVSSGVGRDTTDGIAARACVVVCAGTCPRRRSTRSSFRKRREFHNGSHVK